MVDRTYDELAATILRIADDGGSAQLNAKEARTCGHALQLVRQMDEAEKATASLASVWQQAEDNHRRYSDTGDREGDIRFLTLGLAGEAGEVANFVKKRWRDGDGHDQDIKLEIADVCAYAFMLANVMGLSPQGLMQTIADKQAVFVAKMEARGRG